ncbi:hypothetical protein VSO51_28250, partial [Klebsiella pneumoniae]|nr:hypothetical protein [Klebsiella pneumoniae]
MTIMKVHYSPTDGIPLNSLYLKETSTTERSGSMLGGGISGDSVILGGGGYAGSEIQKTTRSTVFAPPDEVTAEPDNGFVNGMVASHLLCHSGTINRHSLNGA